MATFVGLVAGSIWGLGGLAIACGARAHSIMEGSAFGFVLIPVGGAFVAVIGGVIVGNVVYQLLGGQ